MRSSISWISWLNGPAPRGARKAVCSTARPSVVLIGVAAQHGVAPRFELALGGQVEQEALRRHVDQVLRQIGEDLGRLDAEGLEAPRVARKRLAQIELAAMRLVVAGQRRPGFGAVAARCVHFRLSMILSSLAASAAKARMPSASFSVAIASSFSA